MGQRILQWAARLAELSIRRIARRVHGGLMARLEEEWLADLAEQGGIFGRLRFVSGCCRAAVVIARERAGDSSVPATPRVAAATRRRAPVEDELPLFTASGPAYLIIALLHLGLICGLTAGL